MSTFVQQIPPFFSTNDDIIFKSPPTIERYFKYAFLNLLGSGGKPVFLLECEAHKLLSTGPNISIQCGEIYLRVSSGD